MARPHQPVEPTGYAEFSGPPNPQPPIGEPVELVPPPAPATPGGGTSVPSGSARVCSSTRSAATAFKVFRRLAEVGRTLDPRTYLAAGLLIALAFIGAPSSEVHTGLIEAHWRSRAEVDATPYGMVFDFLQWFWYSARALIALATRLSC